MSVIISSSLGLIGSISILLFVYSWFNCNGLLLIVIVVNIGSKAFKVNSPKKLFIVDYL